MNDEQLLALNKQGLIPGPLETKEEFILRVNHCLNLKDHLKNAPYLTKSFIQSMSSSHFNLKLFDIEPNWIPCFYNNHQLKPWEGGAAWIFIEEEHSPTSAFFQLRSHFKNHQHYLKIYNRDELIAHEMAHVGRMMFHEPKFEELIAFRTSKNHFRRFFGPIIQSSTESILFLLTLMITLVFNFFLILFTDSLQWIFVISMIPFLLIVFAILRLVKRQKQFAAALDTIKKIVKSEEMAEPFLYRLQDREIELFSKMTPAEMIDYAKKQQLLSLRWQVIALAYF